MQPLTNSEMAAFMNCRRGWYITYYRRLKKTRDYASLPSIGTMYHKGLELYYNEGRTDGPEIISAEAAELMSLYPELADQISKDAEKTAIMLEGYFDWVEETGADEGLTVIGAEQGVEVVLGETGYRLRGKIDTRLEREADGAWLQLENKTVGDLVSIPQYAQSAPQFLTYDLLAFLLAREEGGRATDGVILNMAKRVRRTKAAKPPFYARHEVRHNVDELRNHYRHVVAIGGMIEASHVALDSGASHHEVCPPKIDRNHVWSCACQPVTEFMDDGSDFEPFLAEMYEPFDPLERYKEEVA